MSDIINYQNFIGGADVGAVQIRIDGIDYGKSEGSAEIEYVEDIFDSFRAQNGTQPTDKTVTGQAWLLRLNFADPSPALYNILTRGGTVSGNGKSYSAGCELYKSGRANHGHLVELTRLEGCDQPSSDPADKLTFLNMMFTVTGPTEYGPDTQKIIPAEGYAFLDETAGVFWWSGYESSLGLQGLV